MFYMLFIKLRYVQFGAESFRARMIFVDRRSSPPKRKIEEQNLPKLEVVNESGVRDIWDYMPSGHRWAQKPLQYYSCT